MKKLIAICAAAVMLFSFAACGKSDKKPVDDVTTTTSAPVKLINSESGRIMAAEPPTGWKLAHSTSSDQLVYYYSGDQNIPEEDADRLWINIDEFNTPDQMIEKQKETMDQMQKTYTVETKNIDGIEYKALIPDSDFSRFFGIKDGVTVCVSVDQGINTEDQAVKTIIGSIKVLPEN